MRLTMRSGGTAYWKTGENAGYRPDDICFKSEVERLDKLAAYEDAEEQGLLVRLPCKVGDTVWRLAIGTRGKHRTAYPQYVIYEFNISEVYGSKSVVFFGHNIINGKMSTSYEVFREDDFGKTVFLTREEAEAALKGEQTDV